ncbi:MAG: serine/threonine protein kinase [Planctomycetia bacterium]|nr:serine/threonine protein kinase [Planctomycetia bacterium]
MPSPATIEAFLEVVRQSELVDAKRLQACVQRANAAKPPATPRELSEFMVKDGLLTNHQAVLLVKGRHDCFRIGPYRILERLGFGATSNVYLCEHRATHARVAVKAMASGKTKDPVALKRFYREARAASSLDHPNIVRVRDVDWDDSAEFMVMDYVDGASIQDIVQRFGAMDPTRAAHYISQAALGLQFAHEAGLVHRDIKPGNILIDRTGAVKILDMGLARFLQEDDARLTTGEVLGMPEYLSPEQAVDSHNVDRRADIYSLGAVFYFMLTGKAPYFEEKSSAGKLLSKEKRPPKPIKELRPEVPDELVAIVERMMAKKPDDRFQAARDIEDALSPWNETPIDPPPDKEMPQLSPAAMTGQGKGASADEETAPPDQPMSPVVQVLAIVLLGLASFALAWMLFGGKK